MRARILGFCRVSTVRLAAVCVVAFFAGSRTLKTARAVPLLLFEPRFPTLCCSRIGAYDILSLYLLQTLRHVLFLRFWRMVCW